VKHAREQADAVEREKVERERKEKTTRLCLVGRNEPLPRLLMKT
jgi:hypothetical protein